MRLERLSLGGFNHFAGRFVLDLTDLPDGLIAIVGPNGAGKTTALDAAIACLYGPGVANKAFPSRNGTLFQYATSREAFIETEWDLAERGHVKCRVNVDGDRRKAEAVLLEPNLGVCRTQCGGMIGTWLPVNVSGQTSTYRDAVAERFPSLRSLLASAYAAQNRRGGFGDLGQKERLELFVELADLAHLEARSQTARRCQQVADGLSARIRAAVDALSRDLSPEALAAMAARLSVLLDEEATVIAVRAVDVRREEALEAGLPDAIAAAEQHVVARTRADQLAESVGRAEAEIEGHDRAAARIQRDLADAVGAATDRHTGTVTAVAKRRKKAVEAEALLTADRRERIRNNETVLARADEYRASAAAVADAEAAITQARDAERLHRDAAADADRASAAGSRQLVALLAAKRELAAAVERSALIGRVKFGDDCAVEPVCQLVVDAAAARGRIPDLETQVAGEQALRDQLTGLAQASASAQAEVRAAESRRQEAEQRALGNKAAAALVPKIEHAQDRIDEYRRDEVESAAAHAAALAALDAEVTAADDARAAESAAARETAGTRTRESDAARTALADRVLLLSAQAATARSEADGTAGARAALDALAAALRSARDEIGKSDTRRAALGAERTALVARQREAEDRQARVAELSRRLRVVEDEGLGWQALARACGRDGLQRLEIDAAGPVVSDLANDLLRVGYGTQFSVEIVTQVATADGKDVKEKFTILAVDNAHGGEPRDIGDLSGGERVIVEEAIRCALACYVNLRNRTRIETLWRDETTGALDVERAPQYVAMLRRMLTLSGARQCLFVTHVPACAALADAQVRVEAGTATVALPPYRNIEVAA